MDSFVEWQRRKLSDLPRLLRVLVWFGGGFVWLPAWYYFAPQSRSPLSVQRATLITASLIAAWALVVNLQTFFEGRREWQRIQRVTGSDLRSELKNYLRDEMFKEHLGEAQEALKDLDRLDVAADRLVADSRSIIRESERAWTLCESGRKCSTRVPDGDGITVLDKQGISHIVDEPSLATLARTIEVATSPAYTVFIDQSFKSVGTYTGGGGASRIEWHVYVVDNKTRQITGETTLHGSDPPSTITRPSTGPFSGVGSSGEAPRAEFNAWMDKVKSDSARKVGQALSPREQ